MHDGRADQHDAETVDQRGWIGARDFLAVDELLDKICAAAAVFLGPSDTDPSGLVHLLVPIQTALPIVGATFAHHPEAVIARLFLRHVRLKPASNFVTESFIFRAESEIHFVFLQWMEAAD